MKKKDFAITSKTEYNKDFFLIPWFIGPLRASEFVTLKFSIYLYTNCVSNVKFIRRIMSKIEFYVSCYFYILQYHLRDGDENRCLKIQLKNTIYHTIIINTLKNTIHY